MVAEGRSFAAVGRRDVVRTLGGVQVVHRPNGQYVRVAAGGVHREVSVATAITGGGDDDEAGGPSALHGMGERVGAVRLSGGVAKREVHYANSIVSAVGDRPVDRFYDVTHVSLAVGVENP